MASVSHIEPSSAHPRQRAPIHPDDMASRPDHQPANNSPPTPLTDSPYDSDDPLSHPQAISQSTLQAMKPFFPDQPKSLSGIALRAFVLGIALALSAVAMVLLLVFTSSPAWRLPFFIFALSLFHFLEFWTTARTNTLVASVDSFLLTSNWPSYAIAHSAAFLECLFVSLVFPNRSLLPSSISTILLLIGLAVTITGQSVRSLAMLHAGASFNHHVQTRKAASHTLVTTGVYSVLRHPGYFGFFWWGLGTQVVMGNVFCFLAYWAVLWKFFSTRIRHEEGKLVDFFGDDYVVYRKRVGTKIPFVS